MKLMPLAIIRYLPTFSVATVLSFQLQALAAPPDGGFSSTQTGINVPPSSQRDERMVNAGRAFARSAAKVPVKDGSQSYSFKGHTFNVSIPQGWGYVSRTTSMSQSFNFSSAEHPDGGASIFSVIIITAESSGRVPRSEEVQSGMLLPIRQHFTGMVEREVLLNLANNQQIQAVEYRGKANGILPSHGFVAVVRGGEGPDGCVYLITGRDKEAYYEQTRQVFTDILSTLATSKTAAPVPRAIGLGPLSAYFDGISRDLRASWQAVPGFEEPVRFVVKLDQSGKVVEVQPKFGSSSSPAVQAAAGQFLLNRQEALPPVAFTGNPLPVVVELCNQPQKIAVSSDAINWGAYMAEMERSIQQSWLPLKQAGSQRISVWYKVLRDGSVADAKVLRSSGVPEQDAIALKALNRAQPFRPFPDGAPEEVDVQFTFKYNRR